MNVRSWLIPSGVGFVALIAGVGIGSTNASTTTENVAAPATATTTLPAVTVTGATVTKTVPAPAAAAVTRTTTATVRPRAVDAFPGDGTFAVGTDIRAGTYKSDKPESGNCYWQISSDPNGESIIANNNSTGSSLVSVRKGQYLEVDGCAPFRQA